MSAITEPMIHAVRRAYDDGVSPETISQIWDIDKLTAIYIGSRTLYADVEEEERPKGTNGCDFSTRQRPQMLEKALW